MQTQTSIWRVDLLLHFAGGGVVDADRATFGKSLRAVPVWSSWTTIRDPLHPGGAVLSSALRYVRPWRAGGGCRSPTGPRNGAAFPGPSPRVVQWLLGPRTSSSVVENIRQGDPTSFTLKVIDGERLRRLLERAKERRYYEVPWPVGKTTTRTSEAWRRDA